ncbi:VOC family protein [Mesorhizobium sp. M7A.F.Ca.US.006.01.1.1]|uniref:VOC family protein n=1 Tax=Mesorhizobium sp. M7A.F.Ca.US.006.01.1.1 TaxID=2496707 RepID=UPI000FCACA4B|nr:VOC family protein [Mesorhizobium sp. M7A.F.Ca.US.006.01.1.1]RUZ70227.1 VOC family protein [Mesorhizobium sp. M7A.F.Ca.US.006.01.1.1]
MSEFLGFSHTALHVSNLDRSIEFYEGLLGFTVHLRGQAPAHAGRLTGYPEATIERALLTFPGDTSVPGSSPFLELMEFQQVESMPVDTSLANPGTMHFGLWVRDLDALCAELDRKGVQFVSDVVVSSTGTSKGGKLVFALDPDGIAVEFIQSANWPPKF